MISVQEHFYFMMERREAKPMGKNEGNERKERGKL